MLVHPRAHSKPASPFNLTAWWGGNQRTQRKNLLNSTFGAPCIILSPFIEFLSIYLKLSCCAGGVFCYTSGTDRNCATTCAFKGTHLPSDVLNELARAWNPTASYKSHSSLQEFGARACKTLASPWKQLVCDMLRHFDSKHTTGSVEEKSFADRKQSCEHVPRLGHHESGAQTPCVLI